MSRMTAQPAITGLLGGHIEAVSVSPGEVINHVKGGKLKTLVVMADERMKTMPDVPTLKEKGVDLSIGTWRGLIVSQKRRRMWWMFWQRQQRDG